MWWISVAIFGQSGISQNIVSVLDLWRDFNQSFWYLSIFLISFNKFKRILNHIFFKCFNQFVRIYAIRIYQRRSQWLNKWSSIFLKCVRKFNLSKLNTIEIFWFFIMHNFRHFDFFNIHIKIDFVINFFITHLFWNQEINLRSDPQPIWNIYCRQLFVFLFFGYRIGIFFS